MERIVIDSDGAEVVRIAFIEELVGMTLNDSSFLGSTCQEVKQEERVVTPRIGEVDWNEFKKWVATKGPQRYFYHDSTDCALAQYLKHVEGIIPVVGPQFYRAYGQMDGSRPIPLGIAVALYRAKDFQHLAELLAKVEGVSDAQVLELENREELEKIGFML